MIFRLIVSFTAAYGPGLLILPDEHHKDYAAVKRLLMHYNDYHTATEGSVV